MSGGKRTTRRRVVNLSGIPQPLAHKSMAVVSGDTVYVSGQLGKGKDGKPLPTVREQGYQAMRQLQAILEEAGSDLNHIVRLGIYVTDIDDLMTISDIKKELIPEEPPASFGFEVSALALGAKVEIDAIAVLADEA